MQPVAYLRAAITGQGGSRYELVVDGAINLHAYEARGIRTSHARLLKTTDHLGAAGTAYAFSISDNGMTIAGAAMLGRKSRHGDGIVLLGLVLEDSDSGEPGLAIDLLTLINSDGEVYVIEVHDEALPAEPTLQGNYPNPFNAVTIIGFYLPEQQAVELTIYNLLGQQVTTLVDIELGTGYHEVRWKSIDRHGHPLPSGLYFARFLTASTSQTTKLMLLK